MARTTKTYRVVIRDGSSAQRLAPTEQDIEEAQLRDYQKMYHEAKIDAQRIRGGAEVSFEKGSEDRNIEESNNDEKTDFDVGLEALYNDDFGNEIPVD